MNFDKLNNFQIFEDLNESDINKFIKVIEKIKFDVGEKLITEGDKGDCIYLLLISHTVSRAMPYRSI